MMRLIRSEYKKLWKKKVNIILVVLLFGITFLQTYEIYHRKAGQAIVDFDYVSEDQKPIKDGLEYYRYADSYLHKFAGPLDEARIETIVNDFQRISKKYKRKELDEERMRSIYSDQWESLLKNAADGIVTEEWLYDISHGQEDQRLFFDIFYKEDPTLLLYQRIYTGYLEFATSRELYAKDTLGQTDDSFLTIPNISVYRYRFKGSKKEQLGAVVPSDWDEFKQEDLANHYLDTFLSQDLTFDSTVGNNLFIDALQNINYLSILLIILLLSGIFSQETSYKTDQILTPTKEGARRLLYAKLGCGASLAVGIVVIQFLVILGASFLYLPMRSWNLPCIDCGSAMEYVFTYKELILAKICLMVVAALGTACVTMGLSYITKNRFVTSMILCLFLIVDITSGFILNDIFHSLRLFLPVAMLNIENFLSWNTREGLVPLADIAGNFIAWKDIVMLFWVLIIPLIVGIMAWIDRKHIVKNR